MNERIAMNGTFCRERAVVNTQNSVATFSLEHVVLSYNIYVHNIVVYVLVEI